MLFRSFIYVRPKPKEHGLGNQIEGRFEKEQNIVIIEDLVSTGKSSLQVADVLRNEGVNVVGMVSIFNYGFDVAEEAFKNANVPLESLTTYPALIDIAIEKGIVKKEMENILMQWRKNPAQWMQ